jgi:protein-S-isoprenylcysteine O-methyltransferase Ste14
MNFFTGPRILAHIRDIMLLPGLVIGLIPWLIYKPAGRWIPDFISIRIFGGICVLAGILLFGWTVSLFESKAHGTLAPWTGKKVLITCGPYAYSRNPMILGILLILCGEGILFQSLTILAWMVAFFVIYHIQLLYREEPFLRKKFGKPYLSYCQAVNRWLPIHG